jgi:ankyrin repeat protein
MISLNISPYKQKEETALMIASRKGSSDIVKLLVENGADLMATNKVYTEIYNIVIAFVVNVVVMIILVFFDYFIFFSLPILKGDEDAESMAEKKGNKKIVKYLQSKKQEINVV